MTENAANPPAPEPPRLSDLPVVVEPLAPDSGWSTPTVLPRPRGTPVHPLAALLLLGVDNLWNLADWMVIDWIITIPLSFITVFFPVLLIQRLVRRDSWRRAGVLAFLLGVIAAVPTSVFGSPVGLALLAWFGIDRLIGKPRGQ